MIDISSDNLPDWADEPSIYCLACERMSIERQATDWDHIYRANHETNLGGHKHYFNAGDQILPLCRAHHQERHSLGWMAFKKKYMLTDNDLSTLTDYQALDRNELHYQHKPKRRNKGLK